MMQTGDPEATTMQRIAYVLTLLLFSGCATQRPWAHLQPSPEKLTRQVADQVLLDFPHPPPFGWGEGVLMAGMMKAGIALDEPRYIGFVQKWADHWQSKGLQAVIENGVNERMKGYCGIWGPGYPVMLLHERTGDKKYLQMAWQIADFIETRATRTKDGGLGHWMDNYQLWVETLYMVCPLFAELTRQTHNPKYVTQAARQLDLFQGRLQNPDGLFWHMYDEPTDKQVGMLWGRGNGWVAMSYVVVLEQLDKGTPSYTKLHGDFRRQMDALMAMQDNHARLWHTVLDHPETPFETSATAMILFSLVDADRIGLYHPSDRSMIPATWTALANKVNPDGRVIDVSGGTGPARLVDYADKTMGTFTWGTGSFLMAGASLCR
jgi:unsaturated rhamnogalacturonyl hydrolase